MDRRDFLKSTSGLAALATAAAATDAPAMASEAPRTLSFASPWAADHAGLADDAHRLARRIEAALDGAITLELRTGTSARGDITLMPVQSDVALHPAFAFFGGLPGEDALEPRDLMAWLATGGGQDLWDDLARPYGFKPLLAAHTGTDPVLWSRQPISNVEDLAGLRLIARGLDAETVRALGATPILGGEENLEALLASPQIDGAVWGSLVQSAAAGIPAHFSHGLFGALGRTGGTFALNFDLAIWDSLTPAQQLAVTSAAHFECKAALADIEATRASVAAAIRDRFGAIVSYPNPDFRAAVSRIAAALVAHTAAHDSVSARIDRSYTAYRRAIATTDVNVA